MDSLLPGIQRLVEILLRCLDFPFKVDGIVALHVALHMDLLSFGHRNLFGLRLKVGGHCKEKGVALGKLHNVQSEPISASILSSAELENYLIQNLNYFLERQLKTN